MLAERNVPAASLPPIAVFEIPANLQINVGNLFGPTVPAVGSGTVCLGPGQPLYNIYHKVLKRLQMTDSSKITTV